MKSRRALVVLLSLLLVFAQHAAFAHIISHTGHKLPAKEQLAHSKLCEKCVSFEKLSHAVITGSAALLLLNLVFAQAVAADYVYRARTLVAFHIRAPPVFL